MSYRATAYATKGPYNLAAIDGTRNKLRFMEVGDRLWFTCDGERGATNLRCSVATTQRAIGAKFKTRNLAPMHRVSDSETLARYDEMRAREITIEIERTAQREID